MKEYVADKKLGKKLYRLKRKNFKRYKIGLLVSLVMLFIIVSINILLAGKGESSTQSLENVIVGIGFCIIPFFIGILAYALAITGGREVLMSRIEERCIITKEQILVQYIPNPHETTVYKKIVFQINREDIDKIVEEERYGRMVIYGHYRMLKYRNINDQMAAESLYITDMPLYIYGYYKDFNAMKTELLLR